MLLEGMKRHQKLQVPAGQRCNCSWLPCDVWLEKSRWNGSNARGRKQGDHWRRLQKPIPGSCIFTIRTRSETRSIPLSLLLRPSPPLCSSPEARGELRGYRRHSLRARSAARRAGDSWSSLFSGPRADPTGASFQRRTAWHHLPTDRWWRFLGYFFWQSSRDFPGPGRMFVSSKYVYVQSSLPIC